MISIYFEDDFFTKEHAELLENYILGIGFTVQKIRSDGLKIYRSGANDGKHNLPLWIPAGQALNYSDLGGMISRAIEALADWQERDREHVIIDTGILAVDGLLSMVRDKVQS